MIKFQDLKNNKFNLSPHQLNILDYNNKNVFLMIKNTRYYRFI